MNRTNSWIFLATLCLCGLTTAEESNDGFAPLFDGNSLTGWREAPKGKVTAWSVKDGVIRGEGKENRQVYLIYTGDEALADFELKFSYRMLTKGNTGVETRARVDRPKSVGLKVTTPISGMSELAPECWAPGISTSERTHEKSFHARGELGS